MPLEHFSSGVVLSISDEEVTSQVFQTTYSVKWDRMLADVGKYKREPRRAVVQRNREGDGFEVHLFAPKRHLKDGVTVPLTKEATYSEIIRQYGEILA